MIFLYNTVEGTQTSRKFVGEIKIPGGIVPPHLISLIPLIPEVSLDTCTWEKPLPTQVT